MKTRIYRKLPFIQVSDKKIIYPHQQPVPFYTQQHVIFNQFNLSNYFKQKLKITHHLNDKNIQQFLTQQKISLQKHREFIVLGRSNVGKSSLINSLLQTKNLAAVSKSPGKTQQLVFYTFGQNSPLQVSLVDAPGYGYAQAPIKEMNRWKELMQKYLESSRNLWLSVVLIDSKVGLTSLDYMIFDWLKELRRNFCVVLTKTDKLTENEILKRLEQIGKFLGEQEYNDYILACSARNMYGINELKAFLAYKVLI